MPFTSTLAPSFRDQSANHVDQLGSLLLLRLMVRFTTFPTSALVMARVRADLRSPLVFMSSAISSCFHRIIVVSSVVTIVKIALVRSTLVDDCCSSVAFSFSGSSVFFFVSFSLACSFSQNESRKAISPIQAPESPPCF